MTITKTTAGKILLSLWLVTVLILIGLPLVGIFQNEIKGNLAFSLLVCSVLLNLSVIISYKVKTGSEFLSKMMWICLGIIVLGFILFLTYNLTGGSNKEVGIILTYIMLVYSFPISILVSLLFGSIIYISDKYFPFADSVNTYWGIFFIWSIFFIFGYLQWFKLLPSLIRKWQNSKLKR